MSQVRCEIQFLCNKTNPYVLFGVITLLPWFHLTHYLIINATHSLSRIYSRTHAVLCKYIVHWLLRVLHWLHVYTMELLQFVLKLIVLDINMSDVQMSSSHVILVPHDTQENNHRCSVHMLNDRLLQCDSAVPQLQCFHWTWSFYGLMLKT